MSIASLGLRTTNTTISNANVEYRTASIDRPKILEFSFILAAATAISIGFGAPAAIGITPVNVLFQNDDTQDPASIANGALSWGTSPTAPTIYKRKWASTNVVGVGVVWIFPRGLTIPVNSSMVCFNITATDVGDVNCVIDE